MPEYIELTDEVRTDGPVAWMVFTIGDAIHEYKLFTDDRSAEAFSGRMAELSEDGESQAYPLWAAVPGAKPAKPKQLIWIDGRAETPFGDYFSGHAKAREGLVYGWMSWLDKWRWKYKTEAEAQAAAQRDFEQRVKECFKGEQ